ncbi:MAG: amylo-alpha-1,6-glucosidase [Haliscomenobacter sp.]|uniref:amylo-alpha-1,6-glucosidase n=1 Tax=Haliscomenobacter sp. TaxID=2717303 RepID=UPI0029A1B5A4|nr:amylo-alpha-1,6-glucosidase [Haliscomenobacter sp.]MDX2071240.1 amylo-alpha-1,6-glucosidase [Haliscomenobacter sp.]
MNLENKTFEALSGLEWLLTNGLGSFASSSIIGANTRRYHGLLVASNNPPTDRKVLVSKVEETVFRGEERVELGCNQYPGVVHPQGYTFLESFEREPLPRAVFAAEVFKLAKTTSMVYGQNTTVLEYENLGTTAIQLSIQPFLVFRDYHSLFRENPDFDFFVEQVESTRLKVYAHYGATPLFMQFSKGDFAAEGVWYHNFEYAAEQARGLDFQEDAKSIGQIRFDLAPGEKMQLLFSTENKTYTNLASLIGQESKRIKALGAGVKDTFLRDLLISGDQFLVQRRSTNSSTLIAGYPWFTDWGRDTMIAMRGLTIASGKKEVSQSIIRTFLQYLNRGLLPNRFPDSGEMPEYNTFDATLWLFVVLYEYHEKFQDLAFIAEVFPQLEEIIVWHQRGTHYNIHVTPEGLLFGGEDLQQLTWMDAKVGDYVVTPRQGCPVEINALWYNALEIMAVFAQALQQDQQNYVEWAKKTSTAFRHFFINPQGYLNDVILPDGYVDDTMRPNQIYALSLPFGLLNPKEAEKVLDSVEKTLYTNYGLRSLAPDDPQFKGFYGGNPWERDTAYHQGTVWAFLWGEYALAALKVKGNTAETKKLLLEKMEPLKRHFYDADCLYAISEIFDGENPGPGKGCFQQAWSIGMLIKVLYTLQASKR